ncbi:MAG: ATP-binding protein [Candidatus Omnitrophica bacterium]|nr:ATP-binding protein [Candidatus Omnitrophota bacterium]MDD5653567.1 ATP-binding protein [Candidatus Omnitrophota bacterium]
MKIPTKIRLSFLTTAIILTSVASSFFYLYAKKNLQNLINTQLKTVIVSRTQHINTYLEMLKSSVGQLSKSVVVENFLLSRQRNSAQTKQDFELAQKRLENTKKANSAIYEFLLMDAAGNVVASSNTESIGQDRSADSIFLGGKDKVFIKDAYFLDAVKKPLIAVSAPMLNSQTGEFLGVLAARVELTQLNQIVAENMGLFKSEEIYIVNKDGYMITPSRFLNNTFLNEKIDTPNLTAARMHTAEGREHKKREVALISPNYLGVKVLGAHEYIPEMQWAVLAEVNADEVLAPLREILYLFLVILAMVPFFAWIAGALVAKIISGPIHALHKGTEIIGRGNLDYKVGTTAKDEIGQLSRAFDEMTENLKHSTTSIEALNKEIEQRKKTETQVRLAAQEWQRTFDAITDLVFIQDTNFTITKANKIFAEAIKLELNQIIGKKCYELLHKSDKPWPGCPFAKTRIDKESHTEEVDDPHIGIPLLVSTSPIFDEKGNLLGSVHIGKDISNLKKAREELQKYSHDLEAALKVKSNFTSMVSHELRTPLAAIKESVNLVYEGAVGKVNTEQKDLLGTAQTSVDRLARLINGILDFQKLESGAMAFNFVENDLNEVVGEVYKMMAALAENKGLKFSVSYADNLPKFKFDRDKIIQVITNLVNNALKFTDKGGIKLVTLLEENIAHVKVEDTGPGIKEADMPRLFKSFEQLETTRDKRAQGSGIGLAICKEIVMHHSGKIWAESEFGKGSVFHVVLPLKERRENRS